MVGEPSKTIKIFYCYAHKDRELLDELEKHLSPLKRVRYITGWYDREILAGADQALEIETQFNTAHIVLLLLSSDFIASDNCYSLMEKAFEGHKAGRIHVIPVLLRPLIWDTLPISALQSLPHDGRAVTKWSNQDEAFEDVVRGIREVVRTLIPRHMLSSQETIILYLEQVNQSKPPGGNPPAIVPRNPFSQRRLPVKRLSLLMGRTPGLIFLLVVLVVALFSGGTYYVNHALDSLAVTTNCFVSHLPKRGNIFDRNGVLLAESVPLSGSHEDGRQYFDSSLAGLIGYYVNQQYPATGIEKQYDDYLSGRKDTSQACPVAGNDVYLTIDERIQQIANGHFDDATAGTQGSNRGSIIVTDPHTGEILAMVTRPSFDANKMVQTLQNHDVSYYNQLVADKDKPLLERPLQGLYTPGATYETLTLLAGLDSGKTTLNQQFDQKQALGPIQVNGQKLGPEGNNIGPPDANYTFHYPVTTEYGFTHSDNIIFAQIGVETGLTTWLDYNKRFYVGQQIPFDLPVTVSQVLPDGKDTMEDNELAADAFGQGTDFITPFQMSLINNAVANNGQLMRPRLVRQVTEHQTVTDTQQKYQGNVIQTFDQQALSKPISQQTAVQVRQAMYGVPRCGSGLLVAPLVGSRTSIIGQTGTAQIGGAGTFPHGWMITSAPYTVNNPGQLPALTIVAMKENDGHGADAVGPLIAHMYEDVFSQLKEYSQVQLPPLAGLEYCHNTGLLQ